LEAVLLVKRATVLRGVDQSTLLFLKKLLVLLVKRPRVEKPEEVIPYREETLDAVLLVNRPRVEKPEEVIPWRELTFDAVLLVKRPRVEKPEDVIP